MVGHIALSCEDEDVGRSGRGNEVKRLREKQIKQIKTWNRFEMRLADIGLDFEKGRQGGEKTGEEEVWKRLIGNDLQRDVKSSKSQKSKTRKD